MSELGAHPTCRRCSSCRFFENKDESFPYCALGRRIGCSIDAGSWDKATVGLRDQRDPAGYSAALLASCRKFLHLAGISSKVLIRSMSVQKAEVLGCLLF